jgi:acyl-CoA synthetase (AMP-forming)/AMP-acid ligase II
MQQYALTVDRFLEHAAKWAPDREIVTAAAGNVVSRIDYRALRERSNRASGALFSLGMTQGDRFGTLAWNTQHHYFDTGDLACIDEAGVLTIRGRAKDLIKSGGEWINPVEIEDLVSHHPGVGLAAVIGRFDEKWGERPVLVVEPRPGQQVDAQALLDALRSCTIRR